MEKFSEYIGSQFGRPRGVVGKLCCIVMNVINRRLYERAVKEIAKSGASRILDIGYGNGFLIKRLHQKCKAALYGIDISEDMLREAGRRNKKAVAKGAVKLSLGDVCKLRFKKESFDAVVTINTIYFWSDIPKGLSEIHRVLKNSGVFYNVVYAKKWLQRTSYTKKGFAFFEKQDYLQAGEAAGFSKVTIEDITAGKSYIVKYEK